MPASRPGKGRNQRTRERGGGGEPSLRGDFIAYYRVPADPGRSHCCLQAQRQAIANCLNRHSRIVYESTEIEGHQSRDRPELNKALEVARMLDVPVIIVKTGGLKRSRAFLSRLVQADVEVYFADTSAIAKPKGRSLLRNMCAIAEQQARIASVRTKRALAAAKARGKKLGGNRGAKLLAKASTAGCAVIVAQANKRAADISPTIVEIRATGCMSLRSIATALNARGLPATRGGAWSAVQVKRVLRRLSSQVRSIGTGSIA